jgi:hypothetical protein
VARSDIASQGQFTPIGRRLGSTWLGIAWRGSARRGIARQRIATQGQYNSEQKGIIAWFGTASQCIASLVAAARGCARQGNAWLGNSRQGAKMITATAKLKSISPYSQSKPLQSTREANESLDDLDKRIWRERLNVNEQGFVVIPPMAFKNCIAEAAQYLGEKIPGKRNATWTKHFVAGILVVDELVLKIKREQVESERLFVPADGKRGGGTRVWRTFPLIRDWAGTVIFHIIDETITETPFRNHLEKAGQIIGVGRFRPRQNGFYGRFKVESLAWEKA